MFIQRSYKAQSNSNKNPYHEQKKEISQIIRRIDKKRSMEIFLQRSQGSLIQNQLKNRRKTEIKMQEQMKKNQKLSSREKRNTFSFSQPIQAFKNERRLATQSPQRLRKIVELQQNDQQISKQTGQNLIVPLPNPISGQSNNNKEFIRTPKSKPLKFKYGIRPALEELQQYLEEKDPIILERRRRIVQMLILCLMRRCHKKLYEALDIAIQTSSFFQEQDKEVILKCLCMRLIGKIYKQIQIKQKKRKVSIDNKLDSKSTKKFTKKRHSSFMIKTLASQRVFFSRFAHKYKKSKLLRQTNYKKQEYKLKQAYRTSKAQSKNSHLSMKQSLRQDYMGSSSDNLNQIQSKRVVTKLNEKLAVCLPKPEVLFNLQDFSNNNDDQKPKNYNLVIHQRDIESTNKLFPYEYPSSIEKIMSKKEYVYLISAINSKIFTETQCYDVFQVFKKFITQIIGIFSVFLLILLYLLRFDGESALDWIILSALAFLLMAIFTTLLDNGSENIYAAGQTYDKIEHELKKWNKKFSDQNLVFKITQNCEALIICSLNNDQSSFQSNSQLQEADSINQDSLDSQTDKSISLNDQEYDPTYLLNIINPIQCTPDLIQHQGAEFLIRNKTNQEPLIMREKDESSDQSQIVQTDEINFRYPSSEGILDSKKFKSVIQNPIVEKNMQKDKLFNQGDTIKSSYLNFKNEKDFNIDSPDIRENTLQGEGKWAQVGLNLEYGCNQKFNYDQKPYQNKKGQKSIKQIIVVEQDFGQNDPNLQKQRSYVLESEENSLVNSHPDLIQRHQIYSEQKLENSKDGRVEHKNMKNLNYRTKQRLLQQQLSDYLKQVANSLDQYAIQQNSSSEKTESKQNEGLQKSYSMKYFIEEFSQENQAHVNQSKNSLSGNSEKNIFQNKKSNRKEENLEQNKADIFEADEIQFQRHNMQQLLDISFNSEQSDPVIQ